MIDGKDIQYTDLPKEAKEDIEKSPFFYIDNEGKVRFEAYAISLMANALFMERSKLSFFKQVDYFDKVATMSVAFNQNLPIVEQKVANTIVEIFKNIGITPEDLRDMVSKSKQSNEQRNDTEQKSPNVNEDEEPDQLDDWEKLMKSSIQGGN
jgi:hypothetical protein